MIYVRFFLKYSPLHKRPVGQPDTVLPQGVVDDPGYGHSPVDLHQLVGHRLKTLTTDTHHCH